MLPDFPRTKDQIRQRITLGIFHAVRAKAPLLAEIKSYDALMRSGTAR